MRVVSISVVVVLAVGLGLWWSHRSDSMDATANAEWLAKNTARVNDGPYIVRTKQITPTEEVTVLLIPSERGKYFDVRCLIYRNTEYRQAHFTCPEVRQDQLEESQAD